MKLTRLIPFVATAGLMLVPLAAFADEIVPTSTTTTIPTVSLTNTDTCLIKGKGPALYAPMPDGTRQVFLDQRTWDSWYRDSVACIQTVTDATLAQMPLSGAVPIRPGTYLVKVRSYNAVYAVAAPNVLRWVSSEAAAKTVFGADWAKRVIDIDETTLADYTYGAPITAATSYDASTTLAVARPWDQPATDQPKLAVVDRPASNLVNLGITVPPAATLPTSLVDMAAAPQDQTALALCDKDCILTVQLNRPGLFAAETQVNGILHVSNKIALDPLDVSSTPMMLDATSTLPMSTGTTSTDMMGMITLSTTSTPATSTAPVVTSTSQY